MAERTHIPSSPACGEWETLLTDALDGFLNPEDEARFMAHKAVCPACAALDEEAQKGREWLEFLSPEPEAPAGLLEKILAHTGPGHAVPAGWAAGGTFTAGVGTAAIPAFVPPVFTPGHKGRVPGAPEWQREGFFARLRYGMQPRLLMTAAMAFFSIALTLNLAGVHLTSMRLADLRPQALRSYMERQLTMASVPIVRYYDHLRFVYEVESRVRELRGQAQSEGNGEPRRNETQPVTPGETKHNPGQNPGRNDGGLRVDPQQLPDNPAMEPAGGVTNEFLETSLSFDQRSVQSGGSPMRAWERSRVWIA